MEFTFNKNAAHYYSSSKKMFLPVEIIDDIEGFLFRLGGKNYYFRGLETPLNNSCRDGLSRNKFCANKLIEAAGIPVPKAKSINEEDFRQGLLENIIADLNFPLVVKPLFGSYGEDVLCNIANLEQLTVQMTRLFESYQWLTIEEFHGNLNSFRILLLNKKIIGVIQRYPAHVLGDGQLTISELIAKTNIERQQTSEELAPIKLDVECYIRLQQLGITPDYVPLPRERVVLCYTCNASRGGSYEALSLHMCKKNRQFFLKIISLLNLKIAGIDVECVDLNTPIVHSKGVIIEVNSNPSIRIHETPQYGKPNCVTKKIIRSIIYHHPIAYLHVLYRHKTTAPFIRSALIMTVIIATYSLFRVIT